MSYTNKHKCDIKRAYYEDVWRITESNKHSVHNINLRSIKYHLDHIIPISFGFMYNIQPEIIGSIDNLRIISVKDNFKKNQQITNEVKVKLNQFDIDPKCLIKREYIPQITKSAIKQNDNNAPNIFTENQKSLLYYTEENQKKIKAKSKKHVGEKN